MDNVAPTGYDPRAVQPVLKCYIDYLSLATNLHCTNITFMPMPLSSVPLPSKTFFFHHLPQILCSDVLMSLVLRNIAN